MTNETQTESFVAERGEKMITVVINFFTDGISVHARRYR
jgi:hypothetical protein